MLALIDGDLVAFRCAASCENENEAILKHRIDELMYRILNTLVATSHYTYLSGATNLRKVIDPAYKANRLDKARPKFLPDARDYLKFRWNAVEVNNEYEADDAMGVEQCQNVEPTVICSLDKDMLMIPGHHYNWNKDNFTTVSELDGLQHFYKQMLIGDSSDNIQGVKGIGPVKAARLIDPIDNEQEMYDTVRSLYEDSGRFFRNANLLWIHRNHGELWTLRSSHLIMQMSDMSVAQEVLLPLNLSSVMDVLRELGMMDVIGTGRTGTLMEATV